MRGFITVLALAAALAAAGTATANEDIASLGLREDGGMPLAAFRLKLPDTIVIMQAPVTVLGGHSIEIKRKLAPRVSLGATYRYTLGEHLHSERFGLKLTFTN
jgi:hypothetical protein